MEDSIVVHQGRCGGFACPDIPEAGAPSFQRLVRHGDHQHRAIGAELHMGHGGLMLQHLVLGTLQADEVNLVPGDCGHHAVSGAHRE